MDKSIMTIKSKYIFFTVFQFLVSFWKPYKIYCLKYEHFLDGKDYSFSWDVFCNLMGKSYFTLVLL